MEIAAELLEVRDEQELDRFLGSVFNKVKAFAGSAAGKAVGGMLKGVLKKALPIAGASLAHSLEGLLARRLVASLARRPPIYSRWSSRD